MLEEVWTLHLAVATGLETTLSPCLKISGFVVSEVEPSLLTICLVFWLRTACEVLTEPFGGSAEVLPTEEDDCPFLRPEDAVVFVLLAALDD